MSRTPPSRTRDLVGGDAGASGFELRAGGTPDRQAPMERADGVLICEATPDGQDFVLTDVADSPLLLARFGCADAVGRRLSEAIPGLAQSGLLAAMQRVLAAGRTERLTVCLCRCGRPDCWREVMAHRLRGGTILLVTRDITAQRQAEEALRESREVLHGVLNAIPVRVFWKDRNLVYLGCNAAFARDAGFASPEELIGKDDHDMGWREQAALYQADDRAVIESGQGRLLYEEPQTTATGEQIHLLTSKLPLRDAGGNIVGVLGTYYDITAHRRAEQDYRTLFREMLDGFALHEIICDDAGRPSDYRFLAANPAFERMTGLRAQEIVGRTVLEVLPGTERAWIEAYGRVALTGEPARFEGYARDMGKHFRVAAFRPAPGRFACSVADLTAQRRLEDELRQSQKLQAVGQLAAGIAHEINTPAQFVGDSLKFLQDSFGPIRTLIDTYRQAVAGLSASPEHDVLRARLAEAELAADLEFIVDNVPAACREALDGVSRISTIVRAMKEFAHPNQAGKEPADLNRALEATLNIARSEYKQVADIETAFGELPPVLCHIGDLNQVFLNLLVNAAHAIADVVGEHGGRGTIRLRTAHADGRVRIEFADTGRGIPPAIRERIFEPFFTTKPVGTGSGQGLAIARSIVVDKHGGALNCVSEVGKGTTFTILLDVAAPAADPAATPDGPAGVPVPPDLPFDR